MHIIKDILNSPYVKSLIQSVINNLFHNIIKNFTIFFLPTALINGYQEAHFFYISKEDIN